jgi:hypothetical protein
MAFSLARSRVFDRPLSREAAAFQAEMTPARLKRDEIGLNRHRALALCLSMIFSENRFTLFRIML